MTVLVLGGTAEARALAARLAAAGSPVVSSLAGRVRRPRLPDGEVRIGGFGGIDGLHAYLDERAVRAVVDATHPFAARISANAVAACTGAGVPLLRLARPGWGDEPDAVRWCWTADNAEAAAAAAAAGDRVLLTTGRQGLDTYVGPLRGHRVLARTVDPVEIELPDTWRVRLGRGPYTHESERAVMRAHEAQVLVTKDSGGSRAKLDAAAELGVAVVVVQRPAESGSVPSVTDAGAAERWLRSLH